MDIIYVISVIVAVSLFIQFRKKRKEKSSPYLKIRKKLEEELSQAEFSGDWHKRQETNLYLIWLEAISIVESTDLYGYTKDEEHDSLLSKLSIENIKFPSQWNLHDIYSYPFSVGITRAYGQVLANNDYKGMFKPDSILPVPKEYIRKAILFSFDYFNLKETMYEVSDKDERRENLSAINVYLDMSFVDTGNEDIPKIAGENYRVGKVFKERQMEPKGINDIKLIDWRSDLEWVAKGVYWADEGNYEYAFACYDQAKKLGLIKKELDIVHSATYMTKGEEHFDKGEVELAFTEIKKSAELGYEEAKEWLKKASKNKS